MTEQPACSVVVIDDHPLFRKGVAQLLAIDSRFRLAGEAASGEEGVRLALLTRPRLILLDLNMKGMNGIETLAALKKTDLDAVIIILTVSNSEEDLVAAMRSGADGYLLKDTEPEMLLDKLRCAAAGQTVLDPTLVGTLAHALREDHHVPPATDASLTEREGDVLALIAEGLSNKMIARKLDISDGTVKVHVKNLLRKLNLRSRLEAAIWALGQGRERG